MRKLKVENIGHQEDLTNVRRLKATSWVGAQGSTSITGNARVVLIEASLPKIRESLLEGSNESLLKAIVWTKYCLIVV